MSTAGHNRYDYYHAKAPKCPHCGANDKMEDPLSDLFEDEAIVHLDCQSCGKDFVVGVSVSFKYTSYADDNAISDDEFGPAREPTE
jgi:predicted  nucleic acid-binding Zn ribbon protein